MASIGVVILTKNEEKNIKPCIESATFADDILVVDSGSEDATEELAKKEGARFIHHSMGEDGFAGQRNFALKQLDTDWVFYLDADERITPEAAEAIQKVVAENRPAAYNIKRYQIVFGQKMKYGGHGPDFSLRLYPRTMVHWQGVVHEHADIGELEVKLLPGILEHYTYTEWNSYYVKFNLYTTLMAEKMHQDGKRASFKDIILHPMFAFIRFYFLQQGFREGKLGFIFAVNHVFYTMVKYLKLMYMNEQDTGEKK